MEEPPEHAPPAASHRWTRAEIAYAVTLFAAAAVGLALAVTSRGAGHAHVLCERLQRDGVAFAPVDVGRELAGHRDHARAHVHAHDVGGRTEPLAGEPRHDRRPSVAKKPTGAVFEWSPGDAEFELVRGSELPSNNGIEVSADGREFYVASSGFQTIVAFARENPTRQLRSSAPLPITPDNVHLGPDGLLYTAGMKNDVPACGGPPGPQHRLEALSTCPRGTIALTVDPATMEHTVVLDTPDNPAFSNATMALPVGDRLWIGTFRGDRIAYALRR